MLDNLQKYHIILGSKSPRRKQLLEGLGISFDVQIIETDETFPEYFQAVEIPIYLAQKKANAFTLKENDLLITADTIVWFNGEMYGKPADKADAKRMLKKLSGQSHQVITGVCVTTQNQQKTFHVETDVRFVNLTDEEIEYYIENYKPYDKAGSYGVQEWIGYIGVEEIEGSFFNVMGLPIQRLYRELKNW